MLKEYHPPRAPYLSVIAEDEDYLVLNKPSGLLSVPGKHAHLQDCLERRVQEHFTDATTIHRLDMDTSGVIVMARTRHGHKHIGQQFEKRRTQKVYHARVFGDVEGDEGVVDLPLRCDWPNRPKQMVDYELGRKALTRWTVRDREGDVTRIMLYPETGRSHQLRVHMLALGHPILGDNFYAHDTARTMADRLQLHAESLSFMHPRRKEIMTYHAPCPF